MNSFKIYPIFLLLILLLTDCKPKKKFDFYGKWQSLNESGLVIDIDTTNTYSLYRDKKVMLMDDDTLKKQKIQIYSQSDNWYLFKIVSDNSNEDIVNGRIEVVNQDRIRIYFHKHHDILDLADEFHRTNDLISFYPIMNKIMAEK